MDRSSGAATPRAAAAPTFEQWRLLALLVVSVFINYIDRGNLSVSAVDIVKELSLTPSQLGVLLSSFFWTYATCQLLSGWLIDRYNVHWVFAIGFFVWSAATAGTGLAGGFTALLLFRLLLGLGESVAYPAFSKIIASDYHESQRGTANGLIDAGSKVGPALGTLIGGLIVAKYGWRALFLILGFGALIWLPFWAMWTPRGHTQADTKRAHDGYVPGMLELLKVRSVWGTFFGLFAINYAWYFLITWFPYYLIRERHFSTERMAVLGSLPFFVLAVSSALGGWIADRLITSGKSSTVVRKSFIVTGMIGLTLLFPAGIAPNDTVSMALFLVACAAFGVVTPNQWALTQTIAGPVVAGKWTGMQNAFGNMAGVVAPWLTGVIVDKTKSFYLAFVLVAVMVSFGALSYGFIVGRVEERNWGADKKAAA